MPLQKWCNGGMGDVDVESNEVIKGQGCGEKVDWLEWELNDESSYVSRKWEDCSNGLDTSCVVNKYFKHLDL